MHFFFILLIASWVTIFPNNASGSFADIAWIELKPNFSYRDVTFYCFNDPWSTRTFFSAEIENNQITRARIHSSNFQSYSHNKNVLDLTPEEIQGITLHLDKAERYWLNRFELNERLLTWYFFNSSGHLGSCRPPMELSQISPSSFLFEFDSCLKEEPIIAPSSQKGSFKGYKKDGGYYEASLSFSQQQYCRP